MADPRETFKERLGKPLITLRSDLRNIKNAEVGHKSYVEHEIPSYESDGQDSKITQLKARTNDLERISKLLKDKPGQKFLINQGILKASETQGGLIKKVKSGAFNSAKVIGSTLAQVPVNGTGTHFVYAFGGNEYLKSGAGPQTLLGRFLREITGDGLRNAGQSALSGATIIPDNEGQEAYAPIAESELVDRNSKFDNKPGADTPENYLRQDLNSVINLVKGLFNKNQKDKIQGKKPNLSNVFKTSPLNLGQDGFRTEKDAPEIEIQSELKGPETPDSHLSTQGLREIDGRSLVKGTPQGTNTKIIVDNNGGRGYTPQSPDLLSNKQSTDIINVNGTELPIRPDIDPTTGYTGRDGQINTSTEGIESNVVDQQTNIDPTTGYLGRDSGLNTSVQGVESNLTEQSRAVDPSENTYLLQDGRNIARNNGKVSLANVAGTGNDGEFGKHFVSGDEKPSNTNLAPSYINDLTLPIYTLKNGNQAIPGNGITGRITPIENKLYLPENTIDQLAVETAEITDRKDIIPFSFNLFTPDSEYFLYFRAFLDSMDDNYTGEWSGTKYIGRAEEFYTYNGFKRDFNFSFKVAAFNKETLVPLYNKLNYLAGATGPTYSGNGQFMRGTLCSLTIGDYLSNQDGFINKVGLTWDTVYQWEIDVDDNGDPRVPHVLNVSVGFTPIHNFDVKTNLDLTKEVYFGPKKPEVVPPPPPPAPEKREVEYFYSSAGTYTIDKKTKKVIEVNGQPVNYVNGGFEYKADGRQAQITRVNNQNASTRDTAVNDFGEFNEVVVTAPRLNNG